MRRFVAIAAALLCFGIRATAGTYEVGPGKAYAELTDLPKALGGAPDIRLYWRPTPYSARVLLCIDGEVLEGVPAADGSLPVLDCSGPLVGGPLRKDHVPLFAGAGVLMGPPTGDSKFTYKGYSGTHVTVRNLEVTNATHGIYFWQTNGSTAEGNRIHNCVQGIFCSGNGINRYPVIRNNEIWQVGAKGDDHHHGAYIEASNPLVEKNFVHDLVEGSLGAGWKDRSAGLIFRRNDIRGGMHGLDIVNPQESRLWMLREPNWGEDLIEENVLQESNTGGYKLVHYGGENAPEFNRQHLTFRNNTIVAKIDAKKFNSFVLFECTSNVQKVDATGNVLTVSSFTDGKPATSPCWLQDYGTLTESGNTTPKMRDSQRKLLGSISH